MTQETFVLSSQYKTDWYVTADEAERRKLGWDDYRRGDDTTSKPNSHCVDHE